MPTSSNTNYQMKDVELYVFLGGKTLRDKTAGDIMNLLKKCSLIKPKSVLKRQKAAEFQNREDAATFFFYYNKKNCTLCQSLAPLFINPYRSDGRAAAQYRCDRIQDIVLNKSTWCRCADNTASVNVDNSNTETEALSDTGSATTTASEIYEREV